MDGEIMGGKCLVSRKNHAYLHLNSRENWGVKYHFTFAKEHSFCSILERIGRHPACFFC